MRIENIKNIISIDNKIELIGSNSNDDIKYKTDYDFQEVYSVKSIKDKSNIVKKFQKMFNQLVKMKDVFITDFKAGIHKMQPIRWNASNINDGYKLIDNRKILLIECLDNENHNIIKIDIIAYVDGKYSEISCNYYFTDNTSTVKGVQDIYLSLFLDIKKYYREDRLMKMYKRIYSYRVLHKQNVDDLIELFNSDIGFYNMLLHDIDVLIFIRDEDLNVDTKKVNKMTKDIYKQLPDEFQNIKDIDVLQKNLNNLINNLLENY